jgi:hypothetical protein
MFNSFQESINEIRFLEAKKEKIDNLLNAKSFKQYIKRIQNLTWKQN